MRKTIFRSLSTLSNSVKLWEGKMIHQVHIPAKRCASSMTPRLLHQRLLCEMSTQYSTVDQCPHKNAIQNANVPTISPLSHREREQHIIAVTDAWVKQWVFRHNLCPWAGKVVADKALRYRVCNSSPVTKAGQEKLWKRVRDEAALLLLPSLQVDRSEDGIFAQEENQGNSSAMKAHRGVTVETTLIILSHPLIVKNFEIFLDVHQYVEEMLEEAGLDSDIQVATFHPNYQFAPGSTEDGTLANTEDQLQQEAEQYTNRSPFPMLHLLKVNQVMQAVDSVHGDTEKIWRRNIQLMRKMGLSAVKAAQRDIVLSVKAIQE